MIMILLIYTICSMLIWNINGKAIIIKSNFIINIFSKIHNTEILGVSIFYPFNIIRSDLEKNTEIETVNHEEIHSQQISFMTPIIYFIYYIVEYIINRIKRLNHLTSIKNISFEKEAYNNQSNNNYKVEFFSWKNNGR